MHIYKYIMPRSSFFCLIFRLALEQQSVSGWGWSIWDGFNVWVKQMSERARRASKSWQPPTVRANLPFTRIHNTTHTHTNHMHT